MSRPREYCPRCRSYQTMRLARQKRRTRVDGRWQAVEVLNYHCSRCQGLVRSEEVAESGEKAAPPAQAP
ncbi:MAG TPA: hypothetical protein VF234_10780 [Limnochordia bacterium]